MPHVSPAPSRRDILPGMTTWMAMFAGQLLAQAPTLLIYIGGLVFCLVYWRRAPGAAVWAAGGLALLLLASLGSPLVQTSIIMNRTSSGGSSAQISTMMTVTSLAFGVIRAAGTALLVVGVFAGRPQEAPRGFEIPPAMPYR